MSSGCYYGGKGLNQDVDKSFEYLLLFANQGEKEAQLLSGYFNFESVGVSQDYKKNLTLF